MTVPYSGPANPQGAPGAPAANPLTGAFTEDPAAAEAAARLAAGGAVAVPTPTPASVAPAAPSADYVSRSELEELLARARSQEKDKLYPQLERQRTEIEELRRAQEQAAAAQALLLSQQQQQPVPTPPSATPPGGTPNPEDVRALFQSYQREQEERIAEMRSAQQELRDQLERERVIREQEARLFQLREYRQQRLAECADEIAPQFADYVNGNTVEEVDASIELAKTKTQQIMEEIASAQTAQRRGAAPPVTGFPAAPDAMNTGKEQMQVLTAEDIRGMSVEEYAAQRSQLLGAASAQYKQQIGR